MSWYFEVDFIQQCGAVDLWLTKAQQLIDGDQLDQISQENNQQMYSTDVCGVDNKYWNDKTQNFEMSIINHINVIRSVVFSKDWSILASEKEFSKTHM